MKTTLLRTIPFLLIPMTAACSGAGEGPSAGDSPSGGRQRDAATDAAGGAMAADASGGGKAAGLSVFAHAEAVQLCAGECTTLSATVEGQQGKLTLDWNEQLGAEARQEVCPERTTTYTVEAIDVLETAEFEQESRQSSQVTVSVSSCDPQSAVLCEARFRSPVPTAANWLRSDEAWMHAFASDSSLARGPRGSMYLMGAFGNRLDLGADVLEGDAGMHGFVHKMDANCEPVWTRRLDPSVEGDVIVPSAMTSDAQGNVYAVSTSGPLVDLNPLLPVPFRFATELIFYKFAAGGDEVYRTTLPLVFGGGVNDVAVDDAGRLYVPGFAHAFSDFGDGPLGLSPTTYHSFSLSLDANGAHRWTESNTAIYLFERAGDSLVFVHGALAQVDFLASLLGWFSPPGEAPAVVARDLPGFSQRWSVSLESTELWPSLVGGHGDGSAVTLAQDGGSQPLQDEEESTSTLWLTRYDSDGGVHPAVQVMETMQRYEVDEDGYAQFPSLHFVATAQEGHEVAVSGTYYGGELHVKDGPTLAFVEPETNTREASPFGASEVFAAKIGDDDSLAWVRRLEVGEGPSMLGLSMDADGHVWVASQGRVRGTIGADGIGGEQDLVVSKLRALP